jgi:hypothetical protein
MRGSAPALGRWAVRPEGEGLLEGEGLSRRASPTRSACTYRPSASTRHALLMAGVVIVPRGRHFYPGSTMTDGQWALLAPLLPAAGSTGGRRGRPEKWDRRLVLDAIFYVARRGRGPHRYRPCIGRQLRQDRRRAQRRRRAHRTGRQAVVPRDGEGGRQRPGRRADAGREVDDPGAVGRAVVHHPRTVGRPRAERRRHARSG